MSLSLDTLYGECILPTNLRPHECTRQPSSLKKLDVDTGSALSQYMKSVESYDVGRLIHNVFGMLWLIDRAGDIFFCIEEVHSEFGTGVATVFPRKSIDLPPGYFKLGHPSLLPKCADGDSAAKIARLGGDILFDPNFDGGPTWLITRSSGRYGRRNSANFEFAWLQAVADRFLACGVSLVAFDEWEQV